MKGERSFLAMGGCLAYNLPTILSCCNTFHGFMGVIF